MSMSNTQINQLVESLSKLTVLECIELKNTLEEKWGVTAQVAVAASASEEKEEKEEKTSFNVVLKSFPAASKMKIMLALKKDPIKMEIPQLKEATANDTPNYTLIKDTDKETAKAIEAILTDKKIGAVVEIQ